MLGLFQMMGTTSLWGQTSIEFLTAEKCEM